MRHGRIGISLSLQYTTGLKRVEDGNYITGTVKNGMDSGN